MRTVTSCSTCRTRKKRCIQPASGTKCTFCESKRLKCNLKSQAVLLEPNRDTLDELAVEANQHDILLQESVCDELISIYFNLVHNKQQILFHRQTFSAEKRAGVLPVWILLGIFALTARFSENAYFGRTDPRTRGQSILQQALSLFYSRTDLVSLHSLQGCILLAFVCFVEGHREHDGLLAAQAIRMVQILKLPEQLSSQRLQREMEIRLYWQAVMMDTWHSARNKLPLSLRSSATIPRPLEEEHFEEMVFGAAQNVSQHDADQRKTGIWANITQLNETYAEILELHHTITSCSSQAFDLDGKVRMLTSQLDEWLGSLPSHLLFTIANLQSFAVRDRGRELAVMHLIYHYQGILLYYSYLSKKSNDTINPSSCEVASYKIRCQKHAENLSDLMWRTNTTKGMECLWSPLNGHLLVVASSVHLFTLLFEQDPATERVKGLLERNFVMLLQFQKYWPTLEASVSRLQAFHQSCHSGDQEWCFRMDAWMNKFLADYDTLIDERPGRLVEDLACTEYKSNAASGPSPFDFKDMDEYNRLQLALTFGHQALHTDNSDRFSVDLS